MFVTVRHAFSIIAWLPDLTPIERGGLVRQAMLVQMRLLYAGLAENLPVLDLPSCNVPNHTRISRIVPPDPRVS